MKWWQGTKIYLRGVELSDSSYLLSWENNPSNWSISYTDRAFSEDEIIHFIVQQIEQEVHNTLEDIRFIICLLDHLPIGTVDLTGLHSPNPKVEVGILIAEEKHRKKGYAYEAIEGIKQIGKTKFSLSELYCTIQEHNLASQQLFIKAGFIPSPTEQKNDSYQHFIVHL